MIRAYAEAADINDIYSYKFRYGLAVHLLQKGGPIPVISAPLGHASVFVTMQIYMRVTS